MDRNETYLVSLSIGPVQDFIAAALRTRDLWFGSFMLSEISKAAALELSVQGADLVFPGIENRDELSPDSPLNVANRVMAEISGSEQVARQALEQAKTAAKSCLQRFIRQAEERYNKIPEIPPLKSDIWQQQNSEQLELYAAWARVDLQDDQPYLTAERRLDGATAARKNTRNFLASATDPFEAPFAGQPKSSLDARHETILPKSLEARQRLALRLGQGEQLDMMGLVKRLAGGRADKFTSTVRIALDPWVRQVGGKNLEDINKRLEDLIPSELVTRTEGNKRIYRALRYDGGLLYPDRLRVAIKDWPKSGGDENVLKKLKGLQKRMQPLWEEFGQPSPYLALMQADGDDMGKLLDKAKAKRLHQPVSRELADFAMTVPDVVREFFGHCIYAGGDDVLALLPLDNALNCADRLRDQFKRHLSSVAAELNTGPPTFSVGIVFAHMQTPLGRLRQMAKQAEKLAKGDLERDRRNALGILIHPRSGSDLMLRCRWDTNPVSRLHELTGYYRNGDMPAGFGFDLRRTGYLLQGVKPALASEMQDLELDRILKRKNTKGGQTEISSEMRHTIVAQARGCSFDTLTKEHLVARWLGIH